MATTPPQTEKPFHYTYLKEFRVNQCPLFLQHKCTQHRPFTCFHWHFSNQRRRRPLRKRNGTFNYSADVYCSKYNETSGICPDGDDCAYVHRNTGDTERRYHLRYYKTGTCIHETDSKGNCVKNGQHCAFAHGANDLRPPVNDIREQQSQDNVSISTTNAPTDQQKQETVMLTEKIILEDERWQDVNYVLANYKTELCNRPPRLCRQGYACPQYHNTRDRRRNPQESKYRSSPCPTVKQGDDWKDPSCCEKGDNCQFCHTRTEQQFHPEIYKSTKCHDMTQTGYCPRGPFCAFAHVEQEIRIVEEVAPSSPSLLMGSFNQLNDEAPNNLLQHRNSTDILTSNVKENNKPELNQSLSSNQVWNNFSNSFIRDVSDPVQAFPKSSFTTDSIMSKSLPSGPLFMQQLAIDPFSSNTASAMINASYSKAPGSERTTTIDPAISMTNQGTGSTTAWPSISTLPSTNVVEQFSITNASSALLSRPGNSLNSDAAPFYPPDETVDSVVGNALKDLDEPQLQQKTNSASNLLSSQLWNRQRSSSYDSNITSSLFPLSDPVSIQHEKGMRETTPLSLRSGLSSMSPPVLGSVDFPNSLSMPGRYLPMPQSSLVSSSNQSGLSSSHGSGIIDVIELERMQQKCKQWEDSWNQAKAACDAWKREATDANERARLSEERGKLAVERCQFLENKLTSVDACGDSDKNCQFLHQHYDIDDLRKLSVSSLKQLQIKYKADLELVEKLIWEILWKPQQKH